MATYISYTPSSIIAKAMFNFDGMGWYNFKLSGKIRVSVSDMFSYADYLDHKFDSYLFTNPYLSSSEMYWDSDAYANINSLLKNISEYAAISFSEVKDYDYMGSYDSTVDPENVGSANVSDINISWVYRSDWLSSGRSGANSDSFLGYAGSKGDVFLNLYFADSDDFSELSQSRQVLLHEIGHSLGLSHPHSGSNKNNVTSDYAMTQYVGFEKLGFNISSASDMNKEYFSIMSYDEQLSYMYGFEMPAHTPMILDVIALQEAYGEGSGTSGSGDDVITAGTGGYRTYFDKGGTDTINLSYYTDGAYLNMGMTITGANHLVGVGMSLYDGLNTLLLGGEPQHLRWFYGEYENAKGSSATDMIIGNKLANIISGYAGDDIIHGNEGNDSIAGGTGNDSLNGGLGSDKLSGGPGADEFTLDYDDFNFYGSQKLYSDTITDLKMSDGDSIDLSSFGFGVGIAASKSAGIAAGEILFYDTSSGKVYYDIYDNGSPVVILTLSGKPFMTDYYNAFV